MQHSKQQDTKIPSWVISHNLELIIHEGALNARITRQISYKKSFNPIN